MSCLFRYAFFVLPRGVLFSPQFRMCVGDRFPDLPPLRNGQAVTAGLGDRPARQTASIDSSHVRIMELPS